jgi:hypothetical protein
MFGNKKIRLNVGVELAFAKGKPMVKLRGISAWGVASSNS